MSTTKHWRGTQGARDVSTDLTDLARLAVEDAIEDEGIVLFNGLSGTGKTFTLKSIKDDLGGTWFHLPIGPDATGKAFEVELLEAIYSVKMPGKHVDRRRLRGDLRFEIATWLAEGPSVVSVDDFDPSGAAGLTVIRWLFERPVMHAAFIIVGNDVERLARKWPAFYSRIMRVVPFKRIPEEAVVEKMKQYHPFFERSQDALVLRVDQKYGAGNFRNWALFLECTLKTAADLGLDHLSNELIDGVLATLNKTPGRRGDGPLDGAEAA